MLSFYGFMMHHTQDQDYIGALARYMSGKSYFVRSASYDDNLEQLQMMGASKFLIDSFGRAYDGPYTEYIKNQQRVELGLDLRNEIFDRTNCTHDDGEIRSQFRQRPELALLALIARGLFEIADAIRSSK